MSRCKGEIITRINERLHVIELTLPLGRSVHWHGAIASFHDERGIAMRFGRAYHNDREFCVTLCFADAADADAFHECFGGAPLGRRARGAGYRAAAMKENGPST